AVTDAVAGVGNTYTAGSGAGESLVNPPEMPFQPMTAPVWPLGVCNQHDKSMADPADPSDMRYWRWYPAASMLPNGMIVTYGGDDRDTTAPACTHPYDGLGYHCKPGTQSPSPTSGYVDPTSNPGVDAHGNREPGINGSTIQVPVMDVWHHNTDTQVEVE